MLPEPKLQTLQKLVENATKEELIWINGYLTGLVAHTGTAAGSITVQAPPAANAVKKISIVFGTETGNAKKLATAFAAKAKKKGIVVKLTGLDQYRLNDLGKEEYFFTVISTQGEGEPPATAKKFYDHLYAQKDGLNKLRFGVLALGDTAYPLFCKTGEDVDGRLEALGATRLLPLVKCDTDYEAEADAWFEQVLQLLANGGPAQTSAPAPVTTPKKAGKKHYDGVIRTNINLNDAGSAKATHHIEIEVEEEVDYLPGDSIGIVPHNKPAVVDAILQEAGFEGTTKVSFRDEIFTAANLLLQKLNIVYLPQRVVQKYAQLVQQEIPDTRIDLLDLLRIYPIRQPEQFEEVLAIMEPIAPRLYSIASSPVAHSGELHITVARNEFCINEENKNGLCSDFLLLMQEGLPISFYVHHNHQFRLPAPEKDVIMIGPGTGIAPFRSFVAERDATGAAGRNWLFFGEQHFETDFLYQSEWQAYADTGVLHQVNLAFSRDQQQKIYVQHRMLEKGAELYDWLNNGAYLYVCGSKDPMSTDVEKALVTIIERHGNKSTVDAQAYLDELKEQDRYLRDVY